MAFARIKSKLTATALVSTLAIVPVGAGVIAITQPARAQSETAQPTPPPPPSPKDGPKAERDRDGMGRGGHDWKKDRFARHHRHHHRYGNHAMRLAKKLAGVETAIGIRSDQLDAWRHFTSLLVAFASPQWPDVSMAGPDDEDTDSDTSMMPDQTAGDEDAGSDAATPPAPADDTASTADTGGDTSSFGPLNFMVDRAIDRGEKAKELKDAMAKLDAVLTPEQKQAARMLMRHHRHGMRGHGRWGHHGSRDRDGRWGDREDQRGGRM